LVWRFTEAYDRSNIVVLQNTAERIENLNPTLLHEIDKFFVNYQQEYGNKFRVIGRCGPEEALKMVKKAVKRQKTV